MTSHQFDKAESCSSQYALCVISTIGVSHNVDDTKKDSEVNIEERTMLHKYMSL